MWIRQANDLPCIAGIGENFLISGKAGIENDFPAPARDGPGSAAVKDAPVFERKYGWSVLYFRQCFVLPRPSSYTKFSASLVGPAERAEPLPQPQPRPTLVIPSEARDLLFPSFETTRRYLLSASVTDSEPKCSTGQ